MVRRWDGDERGRGVGDARAYVAGAAELLGAMQADGWVAEAPEAHLLPHLEAVCASLPFELRGAHAAADGTYEVDLAWRGERPNVGEIRRALYALAGSIAESASYVRQRRDGVNADVAFELVTGELGDGRFAPHGHALRFMVST